MTDTDDRIATLEDRRDDVEQRIADIKGQLELARAHQQTTGEYADPDWYRKATAAQRYAGLDHQRITRELAELKREQRRERNTTFERCFVSAAKTILTREVYDEISEEARREAGQ